MAGFISRGAANDGMPERVVQIDPDRLWRVFCGCNIHAGAVTDPFHMNYYNFLALIRSCNLPLSAERKLSNGQLGVFFRSVAYASREELMSGKCMRARIFEATRTHKGLDSQREQTHGNKLTYATFIHALTKCAGLVYPKLSARQGLGRFVHKYVLQNSASDGAEEKSGIRLPYDIRLSDAQAFLEDPEVNAFMFEYRDTIDAIFFHLNHISSRINDASASSPKKDKMISYTEYVDFTRSHLWFERSNPNVLSRADIAKIFVTVKHGGGRGVNENLINNQGFKECLVLMALCATHAISIRPPVVHTIAESRSSMSLNQNDLSALTRHKVEIHPVDKIKWLFRRIYNSQVACESKVRHLVAFRHQFGRNLAADGNPFSYLLPYRLGSEISDEHNHSNTYILNSRANESHNRKYHRSRAGRSTSIQNAPEDRDLNQSSTGSIMSFSRGERYMAKRRVSLAPQSEHLSWITLTDDSGKNYYYNQETKQTQWEPPTMGVTRPHAALLSPLTEPVAGDSRATARMQSLNKMAANSAKNDIHTAMRNKSIEKMDLEEEAARVAAQWAASLGAASTDSPDGNSLFLRKNSSAKESKVFEESEEELMRKAVLELGMQNQQGILPWQTDNNYSMAKDLGRRRGSMSMHAANFKS